VIKRVSTTVNWRKQKERKRFAKEFATVPEKMRRKLVMRILQLIVAGIDDNQHNRIKFNTPLPIHSLPLLLSIKVMEEEDR